MTITLQKRKREAKGESRYVRIPRTLLNKIVQQAQAEQRSTVSEMIRVLIERGLQKENQ